MVNTCSTALIILTLVIFFDEILCSFSTSCALLQKYVTSELSFNSTLTFTGVRSLIECGSRYWLSLQNRTLPEVGGMVNSFTLDKAKQICQIGFTATDAVVEVAQLGLAVWSLRK